MPETGVNSAPYVVGKLSAQNWVMSAKAAFRKLS